jgi:cytidyltransferase-like protein
MGNIVVTGSFDDLRSREVRFLQEAAEFGPLTVLLWSDETAEALLNFSPKFPLEERQYMIEAVCYVTQVVVVDVKNQQQLLSLLSLQQPGKIALMEGSSPATLDFCKDNNIPCCIISDQQLAGFPMPVQPEPPPGPDRKKVVVTGCYDWLHSGHVRFFEEVSELGDLYVVVGHDANVRHLKGEGHPLFSQDERLYMVQSIRYVTRAYLTSGWGWMDAEPEITQVIRPELYAVNEDGDVPEKRAFCQQHGIEYVVLKRKPKEGLPRRESTHLRGF